MGRVRRWTSFPILVPLADISVCASREIAEVRRALGAMAAIGTRRAAKLSSDQNGCFTSFSILVILADLSVRTPREIASPGGTHRSGTTVQTWRTLELAIYQGTCHISLLILIVLADLRVRTPWKVASRRSAHWTMPTFDSRWAVKLTIGQNGCFTALCSDSLAQGSVNTCWKVTEDRGAFRTTAVFARRTGKLTGGEGRCPCICDLYISVLW